MLGLTETRIHQRQVGYQGRATLGDGTCLHGPAALTYHDASLTLAECLAGDRPTDEQVKAVCEAQGTLQHAMACIAHREDTDPATDDCCALLALVAGEVDAISSGGRLLTGDAAKLSLARGRYASLRTLVAAIEQVELEVVRPFSVDPAAAALRRSPMWKALLEMHALFACKAAMAAQELACEIGEFTRRPDGLVLGVALNTDTPDDWPDTMAARFVAEPEVQRWFLHFNDRQMERFRVSFPKEASAFMAAAAAT